MQKVKSIKKRDGAVVPYDQQKLTEAIYKAAKAVGYDNKFVANDLANVVTTYLEQYYEKGVPTTEELQAMVEKILIETGHSNIAKAYIRYNISKGKKLAAGIDREVGQSDELFYTNILVDATTRDGVSNWDKGKIASALVKEAGVSEDVANDIATAVEYKILHLDNERRRIPTSLIRELVNYELLNRGFSSKLRKQLVIGVPKYDIKRLIGVDGSNAVSNAVGLATSPASLIDPERLCLTIGENTMRQYALQEIFSKEVADAHLEGRIHIHNLEYPLKLYWLSPSLRQIEQSTIQYSSISSESDVNGALPRMLTSQLCSVLRKGSKFLSEGIELDHINAVYSRVLKGRSETDVTLEAEYLIRELDTDGFSNDSIKPYTVIGLDIGEETSSDIGYRFIRELVSGIVDKRRVSRLSVVNNKPSVHVYVGDETFRDSRSLALLGEVCRLGGVLLVLDREDGSNYIDASRSTYEPGGIREYGNKWHCVGQAVTINLPQAFYRSEAGSGDFYSELDSSIDAAISAHVQKSTIFKRYFIDGTFGSKLGWTVEGRGVLKLGDFSYAVGFIGLNEVVKLLCDKEIGDDENSVRLALRILSYINFKVKEGGNKYGLRLSLEDISNSDAADRCLRIDREIYPRARGLFSMVKGLTSYSGGFHRGGVGSNLLSSMVVENRFKILVNSGSAIIYANRNGLSSPEIISLLQTAFFEAHISRIMVI